MLGAVLGLAGAAIVMRQKSQDLAGAPPEALQVPAAAAARKNRPAGATLSAGGQFDRMPPASQPTWQSEAEPANPAQDASSSGPPGTARAAMLIASDSPQRPLVSLGSTVWSTIPPAPVHPAALAVKADADIPGLKLIFYTVNRQDIDYKC